MHAVGAGRLVAGRYRLHGQIGRGAMGIVWRGRDELLDRDVAVKEVQIAGLTVTPDSESIYQRTLREAKTAARLNHPGVVTVFDVVEQDGGPWIVMELVRARSLDQVVAEDGPLRPVTATDVGEGLLSALSCAHAAGVLHRDVKPSNVLITPEGRAVLTDFGIATFEGDPGLTQAGLVVGTPGFTPPERIRGQPATPASDLWALGATLYAAVEGRGPFDRPGGSAAIISGIINEPAPRAPSAGPLGPVIDALLRADPATRPDAAATARLLAGAAASSRPVTVRAGGAWPTAVSAAPPVPGAADKTADATTAARFAPVLPAGPEPIPDFPGSPGFAEITEFPDLCTSAGLSAPADLPAFMDLPPSADLSRFPPGQAAPLGMAIAPASWEAGDPLSLPRSYRPARPAGGGGGTGGTTGAAGHGGAGAGRPRQRSARTRALVSVLGIGAIAVASVIGWSAYSGSANAPPSSDQAQTGRLTGGAPSTTTGAGRSHGRGAGQTGAGGGASPAVPGGGAANSATSGTSAAGPSPGGSSQSGPGPTGSSGTGGSGGGTGGSGSTTPPPVGYRWLSVTAASGGTVAGFKTAVPTAWNVVRSGVITYLKRPLSNAYIEIDLAPFAYPKPLREAEFLQAEAISEKIYHDYHLVAIEPAVVRGASAAIWRFSWQQLGLGHITVTQTLFVLQTAAGPQDYALTVSAPLLGFPAADLVYGQVLRTFRPLP